MITGKRSASQPTLDSTPMSGCSRNSHIRLATATDVAIVDVKMKRKTARPRRYLSASTARPMPSDEADRHGQQGELDGDPEGVEELVAAGDVDVLVPAVGHAVLALGVAAHVPEPDRLDQRVDRRRAPRITADGAIISKPIGRSRQRLPRRLGHDPTVGDARPTPRCPAVSPSECFLHRSVWRGGHLQETLRWARTGGTVATNLPAVDPETVSPPAEPDLDAIAADLAAVETALDELEAGTFRRRRQSRRRREPRPRRRRGRRRHRARRARRGRRAQGLEGDDVALAPDVEDDGAQRHPLRRHPRPAHRHAGRAPRRARHAVRHPHRRGRRQGARRDEGRADEGRPARQLHRRGPARRGPAGARRRCRPTPRRWRRRSPPRSSRPSSAAPPEQVFRRWDDLPVAAASIGQVHRAETKDRREVAVKVQFPGVGAAIEEDLDGAEVMYPVFSALALNGLDARGLVDELRARMREELDYRLEAGNLAEFARHFAGHPWVRIPALVPELSTVAGADDRVGRRHVVGRVRGDGLAGDQGPRRRGHLALRPALDHAPRRVQRRPAPRQLPLPPRRQRHVPRLRARQALDARRVGAARAEPRRHRRAPRPGPARRRRWSSPASSPRATASTRSRSTTTCRARTGRTSSTSSRSPGTGCATRWGASSTSTAPRRGHRQAQHAAELRHPRPRRVGRQRDPRQAQRAQPVAGDAPRVPHGRPAGDRARRRRAAWRVGAV